MPILLAVVGAVALVVGFVDLVWTTLAASGGGGPLTARTSARLWQGVKATQPRPRHHILRLVGVAVVVTVLVQWVVLLIGGWWLVFHGSPQAVVNDTTQVAASSMQRLHFAISTVSTLGIGDYVAGTTAWGVVSSYAALSGLVTATLGITYLVPVIQAVTQRRTFALYLSTLGRNPYEVALHAWGAARAGTVDQHLIHLSSELTLLAQNHLAYPILHYFHDVSVEASGPVQLATLDEALTLLACGLDREEPSGLHALGPTRNALAAVLETLTAAYISTDEEQPEPPSLDPLRRAGLPTVSDEEFHARLEGEARRRSADLAFVRDDGWEWSNVYRAVDDTLGNGQE